MKSNTEFRWTACPRRNAGCRAQTPAAPTSALHLVTTHEAQNLREALARSWVPLDLQAKLASLAGDNLVYRFIEQNSLMFISLLLAAAEGSFGGGTPADRERLLRVLAYVRKDDDAIHDHKPGGFADDHQEVRTASVELRELLWDFKLWRLRHQVPRLWLDPRAIPA